MYKCRIVVHSLYKFCNFSFFKFWANKMGFDKFFVWPNKMGIFYLNKKMRAILRNKRRHHHQKISHLERIK